MPPKKTKDQNQAEFQRAASSNDLSTLRTIWENSGSEIDPNAKNRQGRTALIESIIKEEKEIFEYLLARNDNDNPKVIDLNIGDKFGYSPLALAAYHGRLEFVKQLTQYEYVDTNNGNQDGKTPLILAASRGYVGVVSYLINLKDSNDNFRVNLDAVDKQNRSALSTAIVNGKLETLNTIIEFKKSNSLSIASDETEKGYMQKVLIIAAKNGNSEVAKSAIALKDNEGEYLVDLNQQDQEKLINSYNHEQVQKAINNDSTAIKREAKRKEAQVKFREKTALKIAGASQYPEIVKIIVEAKLDRGLTLAEDQEEEKSIKEALYGACAANKPEIVDYLLALTGSDNSYYLEVNCKNDKNQNGLDIAAEYKAEDAAKAFLEHREQREMTQVEKGEEKKIKQFFTISVRKNKAEATGYFLELKNSSGEQIVEPTQVINEKGEIDKNGDTPVIQAVKYFNYDSLKVILHGAAERGYKFEDINKENNRGQTPYSLAESNTEFQALFDKYGQYATENNEDSQPREDSAESNQYQEQPETENWGVEELENCEFESLQYTSNATATASNYVGVDQQETLEALGFFPED
jgi:ankyrin repeat protein